MVVGASLLARRFGPSLGGWLVGFPFTSAPVSVFLTLEQGPAFAADAAVGSFESAFADVAFVLVYARLVTRGWPTALAISSLVFFASAGVLVLLSPPPSIALGVALIALFVTPRVMPMRVRLTSAATPVPRWDLPARAVVTTALVLAITALATLLGPVPSGIVAGFPLYASVLAVFAQRAAGPYAGAEVMHGLLRGLFGYVSFFAVITYLLVPLGPLTAYALAAIAVIAVQSVSLAVLRRG